MLSLLAVAAAAPLLFGSTDGVVGFSASASLHDFDGSAGVFSGSFDTETLTGRLSVSASSLRTGLGPRDERLRGYCLEAEKYPEILLQVTSATGALPALQGGSGSGALNLVGELQVRDQLRPVSIPASFAWENGALHLRGSYPLRWGDFGVPDPSLAISTLAPEITVRFDILARPLKE